MYYYMFIVSLVLLKVCVCFMHMFRFSISPIMAGFFFHVEVSHDNGTSHLFNQQQCEQNDCIRGFSC
jgi:hypothetical protein